MFRCICRYRFSLMVQTRFYTTDPLMDQLQTCAGEDQVLQLVGINKAKLSVDHVSCAIRMLWQFQKEKPNVLRTIKLVRNHPQFIALRILAENKIDLMDDRSLVEILYSMTRFKVEEHDSLMQHLVVEGWKRLDGFDMGALSKFSVCLADHHLYTSPIMGHIACIVDNKLDELQNGRILSTLMANISAVISPRLRDRLIEQTDSLMDGTINLYPIHLYKVLCFLRNMNYSHRPLLAKCIQELIPAVSQTDPDILCNIIGVLQYFQFPHSEFQLLVRARLIESMDQCNDPSMFTKLFVVLGPMSSNEICERLEESALRLADKMTHYQTLAVLYTMQEMQCRNSTLIQKIASLVHKNLDSYRLIDLGRVTQVLVRYQTPEIFAELHNHLASELKSSFIPSDVVMLSRFLAMLPCPRVDNQLVCKMKAILPQCNLTDLSYLALAVLKWVKTPTMSNHNPSTVVYGDLLKKINHYGIERMQKMDHINLFLNELKYINGDWLEKVLLEDAINTFDRLLDQITCENSSSVALFIVKTGYLHPPILDKIAAVIIENISKVHYSSLYVTVLPFAVLNYEPPQSEEFFNTCIQHFLPHLSSLDPYHVVRMGYILAVAGYFPEELIKYIFNIDFLAKLDAQLEVTQPGITIRTRFHLMQLNRAVCLEYPEYQIPWFHDQYYQQVQHRVSNSMNSVQCQIHQMLGEILGGMNYVKVSVRTPYYYTIDFECILDKNKNPIPYVDQKTHSADLPKVQWGLDKQLRETKSLPPGAQRIAVEFLGLKSFCRNSSHIMGDRVMKKRHLEMLGYHVIQISSLEWNSMERSTKPAWKEYLRKSLFEDDS